MKPRDRSLLFVALALVVGLLLVGPGHFALQDHAAHGAQACLDCALVGLEPVEPDWNLGVGALIGDEVQADCASPLACEVPNVHAPRGPPRNV